jgi:solute carrier family 25 (mitochondrial phosphate transporter), member 3
MPMLFPTQSCLNEVFANKSPFSRPEPKPRSSDYPLKRPIFSAWSVAETAETAKAKAGQLTDAAVDKYEKASAKAQAKTGNIELYSGKYYAACTVGGILACVCTSERDSNEENLTLTGYHAYCSHTTRSRQMPSTG